MKNPSRLSAAVAAITLTMTLALPLPVRADRIAPPDNPAYIAECGSCHLAFPPQLLDANSWRQLMTGLDRHFGSDASLDPRSRTAIADFLVANAGGRKTGVTADANGKALLRITETAYFQRKHRRIAAATWQRSAIKSPANCAACHPRALAGDFADEGVRIPQ